MNFGCHQLRHDKMSVRLHTMIKLVIFLAQLIPTNLVDATGSSCDILFPKDKNGLTIVKTISQGSDLNNYLSGNMNDFIEKL